MPDSVTSRPQATASPRAHRLPVAVFLVGIVMLAFNLRTAITSLPPLFPELATHLNLAPAGVALLAATPVLCFAAFSGSGAPLSRWLGEERVLLAALVLLAAGLVLRGAAPQLLLFPGTVLASAAIALMNVLLPSLIKRRDPARAGWLIGIYLLSMSAGAILASLLAVPMFTASGGSVPLVLAVWALPAIAATVVWLPQLRFRTAPAGLAAPPPGSRGEPGGHGQPGSRGQPGGEARLKVTRYPLTWQVMAFMGLQSLVYYAALSWLPTLFRDRGVSAVQAGTLLALMQLGGAGTSLLVPALAHRTRDQRWLTGVVVAVTAVGLAGCAFAPVAGAVGWVLLLGAGQGAALGLAIYFTMARAPDPVAAASLSAFAQGAGYLVASAGPLIVAFLHAATGGWAVPFGALLAVQAGQFAAGLLAARPRVLAAG
jgi:CP family cyanate transporter-like MFS transporter